MFNDTTSSVVSSLSTISADVFGIFAAVLLFVALGLANSKRSILLVLIALYPAGVLTYFFPWYDYLSFGSGQHMRQIEMLTIFVVTAVGGVLIFKNYINASYESRTFWRILEITTLSIVTVGLAIALLYHVVGVDHFYNFSIIVTSLFASPYALWLWLIAPLITIQLFVRA